MPRPPRCRRIQQEPNARRFGPLDRRPAGEITLPLEGFEALRLSEVEGLEQEAAAQSMGVSRQTYGRVLATARKTVALALTSGLTLVIQGGAYELVGPGRGRGHRRRGGGGGKGRGRGRQGRAD